MTIYFSLEGVLVNHKLEWLQGSKEVFEGVLDFAKSIGWDVKVLAKYNKKKPESKSEIYDWCNKNLGLSKSKIKPVPNNEDKLKYANPETFLIDPKIEIVNGFLYSGGTAILFDGLASGVKKIQFLIETIKELESETTMNNRSKSSLYPPEVLQARLKYLFRENGFTSPNDEYDFCRNTAYNEADSYLGNYSGAGTEGLNQLGDKYDLITGLFFEQEDYENNRMSDHDKDTIISFPKKIEFEDDLQKKLFEYYSKDNQPYMFHYNKSIFAKIWKNVSYTNNIKGFVYLHYLEQISILMFVYMNLVANILQEELAGKDN